MSWRDELRPASWRGRRFDVWVTDSHFGRRVAVHEYPFRDEPWVEDLGRGIRRLTVIGYLVGDDVAAQQDDMVEAAEQEGAGELVHPTLGLRQVTLVDLATNARHDLGRVIELTFQFLEGGERLVGLQADTVFGVLQAADAADGAAAEDFVSRAGAALKQGQETVQQAQRTVREWTSTAQRLVGSATNVLNSVGSLVPGAGRQFSRFLGGARSPLASVNRAISTVDQQLNRVARARSAVNQAAGDAEDLAGRL